MAWEYNGHAFKSVSTAPWPGPKFWCPYLDSSRDGNNYKIFRYADALLMKAECYCQLEQDPDIAMKYLNMEKLEAMELILGSKAYEQTTHVVAPQEKPERGELQLPPRD